MSAGPRSEGGFGRVWAWPAALGVLTLAGLLSALLGEGGAWWGFCWIALGFPLAVVAFHVLRQR